MSSKQKAEWSVLVRGTPELGERASAAAEAKGIPLPEWLTIAIELLSIPVGGIGEWMAHTIKGATSDFGIDPSGILLALILFILARVFREGARMREDLEGTV